LRWPVEPEKLNGEGKSMIPLWEIVIAIAVAGIIKDVLDRGERSMLRDMRV
jgi:hypothetical protein